MTILSTVLVGANLEQTRQLHDGSIAVFTLTDDDRWIQVRRTGPKTGLFLRAMGLLGLA